jgi:Bacterial aa3 type cytochrome c oxidase subunit IV
LEAQVSGNQDIGPAKETYSGFISLFKWGTVVSVAVTALVVLIIASRAA